MKKGKKKSTFFCVMSNYTDDQTSVTFKVVSMTFWSGSNVSSSRGRKQATGRQTHTNQDREEVIIVVLVLDYTRPYRFKVQGFISPCYMHACSMH